MPWFKVDDGFATSKPVLRIPRRYRCAAIGLWTLAGTWCAKELTDGHVPAHYLEEVGTTKAIADHLVKAELWEITETGWLFIGWEKYQPTRADVLVERQKEADRKRAWREAKAAKTAAGRKASGNSPGGTSPSVPPGVRQSSALPDPTRPDPYLSTSVESESHVPNARRRDEPIPDDWQPSDIHRSKARTMNLDIEFEAEQFRQHAIANDRHQSNWDAAFHTWLGRSKPRTNGRTLTRREQTFIEAEQLKDHPNSAVLQHFGATQKAIGNGT